MFRVKSIEETVRVIQGNLLTLAHAGRFDVIVHGCNCFNTMGSGIARDIKDSLPEAYAVDQQTKRGDRNKLGTYTHAVVPFGKHPSLVVVNAYTQYRYGGGGPHFDYSAFDLVLQELRKNFPSLKFGFPRIGSGLAGGDAVIIQEQIAGRLKGMDVTIVEWDGSQFAYEESH